MQETWYLDKLNSRSNARIILQAARELQLDVPTVYDSYAYNDGSEIASCTTETVYNSLHLETGGRVAVYNNCADTR